jgi:hypothetical protein
MTKLEYIKSIIDWSFTDIEGDLWDEQSISVFPLHSSLETLETSIYGIRIYEIPDESFGYLFSFEALLSLELNSEKFKKRIKQYALQCIIYLIDQYPLFDYSKTITENIDFLKIEDNICFVAFHVETLLNYKVKIDTLIPSFYLKGYFLINNQYRQINNIELDYFKSKNTISLDSLNSLTLTQSNTNLLNNKFIKNLFLSDLIINSNHILRFFLLYQIIEYLFNELRFKTVKDFISSHDHEWLISKYNNSENFIIEFKDEKKIKTEKEIIQNILGDLSFEIFESGIKDNLLKVLGSDVKEDTKKELMIYPFRNKIVHNLRNVDYQSDEVKKICLWFELNIIDTMIHGKLDKYLNQ